MNKIFFLVLFLSSFTCSAQVSDTVIQIQTTDTIHAKKKNFWIKPAIGIAYAGLNYFCYRHLDTRIQKTSQQDKTGFQDFVFHSVSDLGLGKVHGIGWGATTVVSLITKNKKLQKLSIIWGGSLLLNSVITEEVKITFQRHRPNTGDAYNVFDWRKGSRIHRSFFSAHTSNAFTTATVFASIYKDKKWMPPLAYGLATLVGFSRIYNNDHWASDVMAGAAFGFLTAKAVQGLYKLAGKKFLFLPQAGIGYKGIFIAYRL
jgi:membrane-associated phospholipid phosphatase